MESIVSIKAVIRFGHKRWVSQSRETTPLVSWGGDGHRQAAWFAVRSTQYNTTTTCLSKISVQLSVVRMRNYICFWSLSLFRVRLDGKFFVVLDLGCFFFNGCFVAIVVSQKRKNDVDWKRIKIGCWFGEYFRFLHRNHTVI